MEKQYDFYIHNICLLILNNQYQRAIAIIRKIMSQGIKNNQLLVMLSYATKMSQGHSAAIKLLEIEHTNGPLINMALSQYQYEIGAYKNCMSHLDTLRTQNPKTTRNNVESQRQSSQNITSIKTVVTGSFPANDINGKSQRSIIDKLQKNTNLFLHGNKPPVYDDLENQNLDIFAINALNQITNDYRTGKYDKKATVKRYKQVLQERKLTGKLKQYTSKFIGYLTH